MLKKETAGKSLLSFHAILELLGYYKNKHSPWFQQKMVTNLTTTGWIDERVVMWKSSRTNEHKIPFPKNCHPSSNVLSYLRWFGPFEFRDCQPAIHHYKENSQTVTQLYSQGGLVIFV